MRQNYYREDSYFFSTEELEQFVIDAEELNIPEDIYEDLKEAIATAKDNGGEVMVKTYYGAKDGQACIGFENEAGGGDSFVYWLRGQAEKMGANR